MAPRKASQTTTRKTEKNPAKKQTKSLLSAKLDAPSGGATRRINPLTAFLNVPSSASSSQTSQTKDKGKGKAKAELIDLTEDVNEQDTTAGQLWVDLYEPTTEVDLAVHVRKVNDVRGWLTESITGKNKYRKILVLTGPAGTAKTTTLRVLARELDADILEWSGPTTSGFADVSGDGDEDSAFAKFESFMARASSCNNLFASTSQTSRRQFMLLEDLPNILHADTKDRFHSLLRSLVLQKDGKPVPVVIVISDNGMRGEAIDERTSAGGWIGDKSTAIDVRTVLPSDLLHGQYVTQIRFNPIAVTLMKKALQALLTKRFGSSKTQQPTKEVLDIIIDSSNGDIRSAINALQFSCIVPKGAKKKRVQANVVMESVTRREQSLALFHLIGKVLYNKRKGDAPSPSASAKDVQREKDLDASLKDKPLLPEWLGEHDRRTSRVDINDIYADSPIDSSLLGLYVHQNYPQFCNDVDELAALSENLSWVDASGGEQWYQANPYRFHILTAGTLHALPSPVERRHQKVFKPEFFGNLEKEKNAWSSVDDVRRWVSTRALRDPNAWRVGGWSRNSIVTELGGILKARDATMAKASQGSKDANERAPRQHRDFSHLPFVLRSVGRVEQLGETEEDQQDGSMAWDGTIDVEDEAAAAARVGGWLDSDEIEE
ncbi:Rad17-domain-containing protein [Cylindrobasidium torrendii FP15055 ss-10]|uniref:Rad17-domain-containing protein n=1 Tax=Cylindrobasidium torrendii FP15055 ss-10 TaxID=1314674 RepID=A0A0D7BPV0_9AGAR|nr:Rad17-domain-containing protein [Cylindrobasidium torrendii FP15055 ss-10]